VLVRHFYPCFNWKEEEEEEEEEETITHGEM